MNKKFDAISTLIGTIIGAGVLGIPYVVMKSGFGIGLINILFLGFILCLVLLYLGEVTLRTNKIHQIPGYAEKYLGKNGKIFVFIIFTLGIYFSLLAYLIGESKSISYLIFGNTSYSLAFGIAFWLIMSFASYFGIKALKKGEDIGLLILGTLIILITILGLKKLDLTNLTYNITTNFYVPFGVILFAFLGLAAVPEIRRILSKDKILMKSSIIYSYIIVSIIYITFTLVVLGINGKNTPEIATLALGKTFILIGIITMFTSYLSLSIALIDTLHYDFKIKKLKSWTITVIPAFLIYLSLALTNNDSFTKVLGIGGVITGSLSIIAVLLMVESAKKIGERNPEYSIPLPKIIKYGIIIVLLIGAILEILSTIGILN